MAPYTIAVSGNRIDFSMHGSWSAADAANWEREYRAAIARMPAGFVVVGDMSQYPPQSDEIQALHEKLMSYSFQSGAYKAALVVPKAVIAMQMKRLADKSGATPKMAFVGSRREADAFVG